MHKIINVILFAYCFCVTPAFSQGTNETSQVIAWGANADGQCSVPNGLTNVVAIAAGSQHSLAVNADGTVSVWGDIPAPPPGLSNVIAVSAGAHYSLALRTNGTVVGWGWNNEGQCNAPVDLTNAVSISAG